MVLTYGIVLSCPIILFGLGSYTTVDGRYTFGIVLPILRGVLRPLIVATTSMTFATKTNTGDSNNFGPN